MAVTFGNSGDNGSQGTTSFSFNNNGTSLLMTTNGTTSPSGITYNGVALTQIGTNQVSAEFGQTYAMWILPSAASGSNTVVVSGSANLSASCYSVSGYGSNSGFGATTWSSGGSHDLNINTTVADAYVVGFFTIGTFSSLGSGLTSVRNILGDSNTRLWRSTTAVSSPTTFTATFNSSGNNDGIVLAVGINPVTSTAYDITAALGTFALTGIDAALAYGKVLAADLGTFVLTGFDAMFKVAITFAADVGEFVLTGIDAVLNYGRSMALDVGSFVLTGFDALMMKGINMAADLGEFVLTGIDAGMSYGRQLMAGVGTFVLTGFAAKFPIFWDNTTKNVVSMVNKVKTALGSWVNTDKTNI
jgi:hypothetical protein